MRPNLPIITREKHGTTTFDFIPSRTMARDAFPSGEGFALNDQDLNKEVRRCPKNYFIIPG